MTKLVELKKKYDSSEGQWGWQVDLNVSLVKQLIDYYMAHMRSLR